jgi:hypothetical protein
MKDIGLTGDAAMDSTLNDEVSRGEPFKAIGTSVKTVTHKGGNPFAGIVGMVNRGIDKLTTPDTSAIDAQIAQRKRTNQTLQNNRTMRKYGI